MEIQELSSQELIQISKGLQAFKESEAYKFYVEEIENVVVMTTKTITAFTPANLQQVIAREQAVGELKQLIYFQEYFDKRQKDVLNQIERNREDVE